MAELVVVRYLYGRTLVGIFSTVEKAKVAALNHIKLLSDKEVKIDDKCLDEIFYYIEEEDKMLVGEKTLVIEKWTVDKACVDGKWVIL